MGTDDRADGGNEDFCIGELGGNHVTQFPGNLRTVTVADDDLSADFQLEEIAWKPWKRFQT